MVPLYHGSALKVYVAYTKHCSLAEQLRRHERRKGPEERAERAFRPPIEIRTPTTSKHNQIIHPFLQRPQGLAQSNMGRKGQEGLLVFTICPHCVLVERFVVMPH